MDILDQSTRAREGGACRLVLSYSGPSKRPAPGRLTAIVDCAVVGVALMVIYLCFTCSCGGKREQAELARTTTDLQNLTEAVSEFESHAGRLPTQQEGLAVLLKVPPDVANWGGPYLRGPVADPWNHPYIYRVTAGAGFEIRSAGRDGRPDTSDDVVGPRRGPYIPAGNFSFDGTGRDESSTPF